MKKKLVEFIEATVNVLTGHEKRLKVLEAERSGFSVLNEDRKKLIEKFLDATKGPGISGFYYCDPPDSEENGEISPTCFCCEDSCINCDRSGRCPIHLSRCDDLEVCTKCSFNNSCTV
jgi:hypothetical protein